MKKNILIFMSIVLIIIVLAFVIVSKVNNKTSNISVNQQNPEVELEQKVEYRIQKEELKNKYGIERDIENLKYEEMSSNEIQYMTELSELEKELTYKDLKDEDLEITE